MIRGLLERLVGVLGRNRTETEGQPEESDLSEAEDSSGFVPSRLDASVLESHGMETTRAERELTQLQEQAERLEEQDHER